MAATRFFEEQAKYEYIQFVIPDCNGIARGKIYRGKAKEKVAKQGFEINCVLCMAGPNSELPFSTRQILGKNVPNEEMRPCLETLIPWPWIASNGRGVGNVLCDLIMSDGKPDLTSPRQLMKAQLDMLRENHGLIFKSAFEYEFYVFKEDTLEPLGQNGLQCFGVKIWGQNHDLFCDLADALEDMGVGLSCFVQEYSPGQWEINTEPYEGLQGGDVAFYVKSAVKGLFQTRGYDATFMTKPVAESAGSGLHLNYSLWTEEETGGKSVMMDKEDPSLLSSTAQHFLAGVLAHAPAITALCCPTLNCYRRLFRKSTPSKINWGVDNRNALMRVHTAQENVFFENRLPSSACNPYLAIAATVAAGMDGLNRKLKIPKAMDAEQGGELPTSLSQALDDLENDVQLRSFLGDRFVSCYTKSKRECEVKPFEEAILKSEENQLVFEREMYLKNF